MTSTEPLPDIFSDRDEPVSEALLLQAVRDGSTAAFGVLYARYRPLAVGVAQRALAPADASGAEDVAEVAFIRVLTALRNGKGPTDTLRAYLTTTVRREAWRYQRRRRRQSEVVERWAVDEDRAAEPDSQAVPEPSALGAHVLLSEAFRGLSDRWRHVLWLTEVEGRKPAEVAPMLGMSAGSASALAYRARNGLITAYFAVYGRAASDEACRAISDRLVAFVAAGSPASGYADVAHHLEGCAACRDATHGVDVLGTVLAGLAPFGLLTAGWWAQAAGVGAAGLAGSAAAAGGSAAAAHGLAGSTATAGSAAVGGVGVGAAVAAAAAVVVLVGAAAFGLARDDGGQTAAAPPPATAPAATGSSGANGSSRTTGSGTEATQVSGADLTAPETATSSVPSTTAPASTTLPADPTVPSPTTPRATEPPASAPTTTQPTAPATTTTVGPATTTTTPDPVADPGALSGRAIKGRRYIDGVQTPVAGVAVVAYDEAGDLSGSGATGSDGRWVIEDLPEGRYLVVAVVPVAYRPAAGADPWQSGDTWATILGSVDVAGQDLGLHDLRLMDR